MGDDSVVRLALASKLRNMVLAPDAIVYAQ